jgi:hypothetical protein
MPEPVTPQDATNTLQQGVNLPPAAKKKPAKRPVQQELFTAAWNKLIRLAAELDDKGQYKEAEEIHRILRKHQNRLTDFEIRVEK